MAKTVDKKLEKQLVALTEQELAQIIGGANGSHTGGGPATVISDTSGDI
jgi:bacteriocin-like protein